MAELNDNLYKLNKFLQDNPNLSKRRYGESATLIAIDIMKELMMKVEVYEKALIRINEYIPTKENYGRDIHNLKTVADNALWLK